MKSGRSAAIAVVTSLCLFSCGSGGGGGDEGGSVPPTVSMFSLLEAGQARFCLLPHDPNPSTSFGIPLTVEYGDLELRLQPTVTINMPAALVTAFDSVVIDPAIDAHVNVTVTSTSTSITLAFTDDGGTTPWFPGYTTQRDMCNLLFNGVSAGTYALTLGSASAKDLSNNNYPLTWLLPASTLSVAGPQILTTSLATGYVGESYGAVLGASHFDEPITWTVHAGALPAGLHLTSEGALGGVPTTTTTGTYNITVRATGQNAATDDQSYALTLANRGPSLLSARFQDTNANQSVNAGDKIVLRLSEDVDYGSAWNSAVAPSRSGDSWGAATVAYGEQEDVIVITLGTGCVLGALGGNSGVAATQVANGVTDTTNVQIVSGTIQIAPELPGYGRRDWVVGSAVTPIRLDAAPFSSLGYTVSGLPAGLTVSSGQISGTPTAAGEGVIRVKNSSGTELDAFPWIVTSVALPSGFGLEQFRADDLHPGDLLALIVRTSDESTAITASIGSVSLIEAPRVDWRHRLFVLPASTVSGSLVIQQGSSSYNAGAVVVSARTNPNPSGPHVATINVWIAVSYSNGVVHVAGLAFGSSPTFTVAGVSVTPIFAGTTHAVLALPSEAHGTGTFEVVVCDGILCSPSPEEERLANAFPNVDKNKDVAGRKADLCKLADETNKRLGRTGDKAEEAKNLLVLIAMKEGKICQRVQGDMNGNGVLDTGETFGPAYGMYQMEANTFKGLWNGQPGGGGEATSKLAKEKLTAISGCTEAEMQRAVNAISDNKYSDKICTLLRTNDLFATAAANLYLKSDPAPLTDADAPVVNAPGSGNNTGGTPTQQAEKYNKFLCALADDWWKFWKKAETAGGRSKADEIASAKENAKRLWC